MSKDAKDKDAKPAEGEQTAPPPRNKKMLLIIIVAVVLVVVIGGGIGAFLLLKKPPAEDDPDAEPTEQKVDKKADKKKNDHPPVFVTLEPFTVNLIPETGDQYLQVGLALECEDPTADGQIKGAMPKIRNGITLLLSGKKASELASRDGKEKLAKELKATINEVFEGHGGHDTEKDSKKDKKHADPGSVVKEVLFTSFIIQ